MTKLRRITLDDVMAVTGLGPRTTARLVREGRLPGCFEGRHYICTPGEFDEWYEGRRPQRSQQVHDVTPFLRTRKAS